MKFVSNYHKQNHRRECIRKGCLQLCSRAIVFNVISSAKYVINLPPPSVTYHSELGQHWFRKWLVACSVLCHYLNQCQLIIPPATKLGGGVYWIHPVCPSVCLLPFRVRPVASTVQDGFFPYLAQMINSMRGCVACDDLWPWPISSRSFGLDLENRVRSVASTVPDGFFLYLAQVITIIRGCVACYVFFRIWKFEFLANFWNFSALTLKKNQQFSMDSFHI